jgi:hypothetical protein
MNHLLLPIVASLLASTSLLSNVYAQSNDMFPTKAAAEKRAKELKCSGAFSMGGEWMPCKDLDTYEKTSKKQP